MRKFLTAEWQDLIMVSYEVDPKLLVDRIPPGTELDLHEGHCFISLVGFMFLNTRVLGIPIPGHVNFEEVNLRFYVRHQAGDEVRRGVTFIKEIVPRHLICWVARTFYGEPYEQWQMSNFRSDKEVRYEWRRGALRNFIAATIGVNQGSPEGGSHGEFITEHYWGYTKRSSNRSDEYKVAHNRWELFSVEESEVDVDFASVYGSEFAFLGDAKPYSVLFTRGSNIAVYKGERLK